MIKAIVLDIDGVVVGNQEGVNFPHPSKKVSAILRKIHDSGIPVSFLTGKPTFAASKNIKSVGIDNPHIADGGATIFNPMQNQIIHSENIDKKDILNLLKKLPRKTYVNLFSTKNYYLDKSQENEFTKTYGKFVGLYPNLVNGFEEVINDEPIPKINIYAFDEQQKEKITKSIKNSSDSIAFSWSTNPFISPVQVLVITNKKASKRSGVKYLAKYLGVLLDNILGVGDTIHDWDFIEICGYRGAMENATAQLKEKINATDPRQVIGGHVNDDGIIKIFKYFKLI